MPPTIIAFDDPLPPAEDRRTLLGGKGAGLAEMVQDLHLPVPPGFVITTDMCDAFLRRGWPAELEPELASHLKGIEQRTGQAFGDPRHPLLLAVRSGAPVSMPGMMDTVLNVGMTPAVRDGLARATGNKLFAADTWLRFVGQYAGTVLGFDIDTDPGDRPPGAMLARADQIVADAAERGGIPADPHIQLRQAIEAVFRSWQSDRARTFRKHEGIPDRPGTAAVVQAMVFGNADEQSGTGVAFSRDPASGEARAYGDYLPRAQGEDVVAGRHAVRDLSQLRDQVPGAYAELEGILQRVERHYRDLCEVEFTVASGQLWILQARPGRRSPISAVRVAVAMAEDPAFPLTRAEAVTRVDDDLIRELSRMGSIAATAPPVANGLAASPGVGTGVLVCDPDSAALLAAAGQAVVLVRNETSPADVHGMVGAAAVVTMTGGVASHAAVVARGWAIPAVTGVGGSVIPGTGVEIGGALIRERETLTVDGTTGAIYRGDHRGPSSTDVPELSLLRRWAVDEGTSSDATGIREPTLLEIARTIQLKGICPVDRVAAATDSSTAWVEDATRSATGLFVATARGLMLSPDGSAWVEDRLVKERQVIDGTAITRCYERFLPLNRAFKELVTRWQRDPKTTPETGEWDSRLAGLGELHHRFQPLVEETCEVVPRLAAYPGRFARALDGLSAGDTSMLAAPLKDSYHTVWFEYHEELIALTGGNRARGDHG